MIPTKETNPKKASSEEVLFNQLKDQLLDPLARNLANEVHWWNLKGLSRQGSDKYPIVLTGKGSPLLLLHGFDSSFLEFRRLVPLLNKHHQLIIPDLFGFGFCPRPTDGDYGEQGLLLHLNKILSRLPSTSPIGLIGASMGGAVAMKIARLHPKRINRILLLAPAGLTGKKMRLPPLIDKLGVCFLSQPQVRRALCRQAFADPSKSVGSAEEQIASLHLKVTGWNKSLSKFAREGGLANCGLPLPPQPIHSIWGENDRILKGSVKQEALDLLVGKTEELSNCGHLPHLDQPEYVAERWLNEFPKDE